MVDVEKNVQTVKNIVKFFEEPRRTQVREMLEGPVGEFFFTAPASSRVEYHSCYPGGLVQHSLNVVSCLLELAGAMCPEKYDKGTLGFVGLFHDLGKAGDGENPCYVPHPSDWHREKGKLYQLNPKCVQMPSSERGLYVLQKHGIVLSSDEYLAIRLNDGQHDENNKWYRMREPELALLVHWADMWSVKQEKQASSLR